MSLTSMWTPFSDLYWPSNDRFREPCVVIIWYKSSDLTVANGFRKNSNRKKSDLSSICHFAGNKPRCHFHMCRLTLRQMDTMVQVTDKECETKFRWVRYSLSSWHRSDENNESLFLDEGSLIEIIILIEIDITAGRKQYYRLHHSSR